MCRIRGHNTYLCTCSAGPLTAHRRYTRYINFRERWKGYLWQGRFASFPMEESYLLAAARYVEQNPVKAGIVHETWDYTWSSVHAYLAGKSDGVVTVEPMLSRVDNWKEFIAGTSMGDDEYFRQQIGRDYGNGNQSSTLPLFALIRPRVPSFLNAEMFLFSPPTDFSGSGW